MTTSIWRDLHAEDNGKDWHYVDYCNSTGTRNAIGLYSENAIAIQNESGDSNGGTV